jgi:hypothetical protein
MSTSITSDPKTLPLPDDAVMAALYALATGKELVLNPETGQMAVVLGRGKAALIEGRHLDELFLRGWIEANDEVRTVTTTEKGMYWAKRWVEKENRRKS